MSQSLSPRGFGMVTYTEDPRIHRVLLRILKEFGGVEPIIAHPLKFEVFHQLPPVTPSTSGISLLLRDHGPIYGKQQLTLDVGRDLFLVARTSRRFCDEEGLACRIGDFAELHPGFPEGELTFALLGDNDVRVTFYPADPAVQARLLEKIQKLQSKSA